MAGSMLQVSRPMSVKEISAKAQDFEFNPFIALKYWLRTAETLLREAYIYEQEDNDQQAYLLLMRYAALIMEKLPLHPTVKDPETRTAMRTAQKNLDEVLNRLEALRPRIDDRYNKWQKAQERRREATESIRVERPGSRSQMDMAASDPAVAGNMTTLGAAENSDLAIKLAHKELRRRDAKRKATRQSGVSEEEEQERRTAGLWDDWEAALSRDGQADRPRDDDKTRQQMEDSRRRTDGQDDVLDGARRRLVKPSSQSTRLAEPNGRSEYRYPSINKTESVKFGDISKLRSTSKTPPPAYAPSSRPPSYLPPKPPKESLFEEPPFRPEKVTPEPLDTMMDEKSSSSFTFRPSAYLENGKPLRTVFLPPDLRQRFLYLASSNTRNNLETCGMLCGTLISNALFVSRLVIPEQESTSDTCETVNESAFFDYCASEDLMVLGWIHTHPTQTCFMSSRDLHTHSGYQIMMPESIAIVCAPSKNPSWGVFRLTDPPGIQSVLNCRQTGLFHPHSERNIYTDALRPGHVFEAEGLEFQVVDMRPK